MMTKYKFAGMLCALLAVSLGMSLLPAVSAAPPSAGKITGSVKLDGQAPHQKPIDMSKEPACAKSYSTPPTMENVLVGPNSALENVVVYISAGAPDEATAPAQVATITQKGCRYIAHITAMKVGQELKVVNDDPTSHNIHPLAKINHEWNKSQPPGAPPLSEHFDKEAFIPVKCNVHLWMHGYFAVLKTAHFAVTGDSGGF